MQHINPNKGISSYGIRRKVKFIMHLCFTNKYCITIAWNSVFDYAIFLANNTPPNKFQGTLSY